MKIEIEVQDNVKPITRSVMQDGRTLVVVFDLEQEQEQTMPICVHAESKARFQKDVDEHGESWAIDHWQVRDISSQWINLGSCPTWHDQWEYRRVIKIGNRKVSEPVTELNEFQKYWYVSPNGFFCEDENLGGYNESVWLKNKAVRLTEEDARELHEALLAVLAGDD